MPISTLRSRKGVQRMILQSINSSRLYPGVMRPVGGGIASLPVPMDFGEPANLESGLLCSNLRARTSDSHHQAPPARSFVEPEIARNRAADDEQPHPQCTFSVSPVFSSSSDRRGTYRSVERQNVLLTGKIVTLTRRLTLNAPWVLPRAEIIINERALGFCLKRVARVPLIRRWSRFHPVAADTTARAARGTRRLPRGRSSCLQSRRPGDGTTGVGRSFTSPGLS